MYHASHDVTLCIGNSTVGLGSKGLLNSKLVQFTSGSLRVFPNRSVLFQLTDSAMTRLRNLGQRIVSLHRRLSWKRAEFCDEQYSQLQNECTLRQHRKIENLKNEQKGEPKRARLLSLRSAIACPNSSDLCDPSCGPNHFRIEKAY